MWMCEQTQLLSEEHSFLYGCKLPSSACFYSPNPISPTWNIRFHFFLLWLSCGSASIYIRALFPSDFVYFHVPFHCNTFCEPPCTFHSSPYIVVWESFCADSGARVNCTLDKHACLPIALLFSDDSFSLSVLRSIYSLYVCVKVVKSL